MRRAERAAALIICIVLAWLFAWAIPGALINATAQQFEHEHEEAATWQP